MSLFVEYVKMALKNIYSNKGRSLLTMLGIIIGIASVIMIISVGEGAAASMSTSLESFGGGQIYVLTSGTATAVGVFITPDDIEAIEDRVSGVDAVTASQSAAGETATGKGSFGVSVTGTMPGNFQMSTNILKHGRYLSEDDVNGARNVCVISSADARRLFGSDDVVGMDIELNMGGVLRTLQIIGVTEPQESNFMMTFTYEGMPVTIDVPYTILEDVVLNFDQFPFVQVLGDGVVDSNDLAARVVRLLEARHQAAGEDYFMVQSFQDVLGQINSIMGLLTLFISAVAGISLLVGGIGVMNIMLVSVTERTREIGIRKSLGAKTSSILVQFLAESAFLTVIGGIIGIILGIVGAIAITAAISSSGTQVQASITLSTISIATLFSMAVGVFFGIYPARKAARLSPIEALRRE